MSGGCEILRLWQEVFRAIINRAGNFSPNSITSLKLCPSASLMSSIELSLESSSGREKENHKNFFQCIPGEQGVMRRQCERRGVFCSLSMNKESGTITELLCFASINGVIGLGSTGLQSSHFLVSPPLSLLYHPVPCHRFPKLENQFHFAHVCLSLILVLPKQEALQQLTRPLWSLFSTWVSFSHK